MAINLKSTNTVKMNGLKVLVYGMAGSGTSAWTRRAIGTTPCWS